MITLNGTTASNNLSLASSDMVCFGNKSFHKPLYHELCKFVDSTLAYDLALLSVRRMYL